VPIGLYCFNFASMSISDQFFFNVFNYYKKANKKLASRIAVIYIDLLHISFLLLLGIFFSVFFNQMNVRFMSSEKAWILFVIAAIIICFKNWIQFSGKKRKVMNAKISNSKSKHFSIWLLWSLPVMCFALSIILSQAF
jgi:hypothetical protein